MATLKQSEKTLALGKTLVDLFSDHGRIDLTSAWMAQYLAELIHEVENEKNAARKKQLQQTCTETILELWKRRKYYPGSIRPLEGVAEVIPVLKALQEPDERNNFSWRRYRDLENETAWGHFIAKARTNMEEIVKICVLAQLTEESLKNEKKWKKHFDLLSEVEQKFSTNLDSLINSTTYKDFEVTIQIVDPTKKVKVKKAKPQPPKDRRTLIFEKLDSLLSDQVEALNELREKLEPSPKRKKANDCNYNEK